MLLSGMSQKRPIMMSPDNIREEFASAVAGVGDDVETEVVQNLSRALAALQQAGIDLTFDISGWCGSDSFKSINGGNATFSGLLSLGNNTHVLSLLTKGDGVKVLALAYYNSRLGQIDTRTWMYDITDKDCYVDLQKRIIELAARNQYLSDNDVAGAFRSEGARDNVRLRLPKPASSGAK